VYSTALWICALFATGIFAVMLYSVATFRSTPAASAAGYRRSAAAEILWALVPIIILVSAAAPALRFAML
jgi:cytochrome c oxidase subunit II